MRTWLVHCTPNIIPTYRNPILTRRLGWLRQTCQKQITQSRQTTVYPNAKSFRPSRRALNPITSYPETYQRMNKEARDQVSRGVDQVTDGHGIVDVAKGAGNVALGTLGYVASPINAAYRSVIGQPIEDTTGVPREYTEFAAQLATPGIGFTGKAPAPSIAPTKTLSPGQEVAAAADRLSQTGSPVQIPRAVTTDSIPVQQAAWARQISPLPARRWSRPLKKQSIRLARRPMKSRKVLAAPLRLGRGRHGAFGDQGLDYGRKCEGYQQSVQEGGWPR
jgi:hypothetical protein